MTNSENDASYKIVGMQFDTNEKEIEVLNSKEKRYPQKEDFALEIPAYDGPIRKNQDNDRQGR